MAANPFASIDQTGVGQLMEIAIEKGRSTRPDIKLGICGEHGGDPKSVNFCHKIGLSYVSCSPYRVPVARLAAGTACRIADLHGDVERDRNLIFRETSLTEKAELVPGHLRPEGTSVDHDMLTGSDSHGRALPGRGLDDTAGGGVRIRIFGGSLDPDQPRVGFQQNFTCNNWTYDGSEAAAMVGHHDRNGAWNTSWSSSHPTEGCSLDDFRDTGGSGRFYCFAAD